MNELKKLDIALFVNNVGTSVIRLFHKVEYQKIVDIININCTGMAALSSDVITLMKDRPKKSALINLSSYME